MKKFTLLLLILLVLGWGALVKPQPAWAEKDLWTELESLANDASYKVQVSTNQDKYKLDDKLVLTCQIEKAGYVNVIHVQHGDQRATVLFPNKYHPENHVQANTTIKIPEGDEFIIRVIPPAGEHLVVVFHTEQDINAYREGQGNKDVTFKTVATQFTKKLAVEGKKEPGYGAGKIITVVED